MSGRCANVWMLVQKWRAVGQSLAKERQREGLIPGIRFLNPGNHNNRFDRRAKLRVASVHKAILALARLLSSKVEIREWCTQVRVAHWVTLIFEEGRMVCGSQLYGEGNQG